MGRILSSLPGACRRRASLTFPRFPLLALVGALVILSGCERVRLLRPRKEPLPGAIRNHFHYDLHHPRKGETLTSIGRDFGIPVGVLAYVNGVRPQERLPKGVPVKVPFWEELFKGRPTRVGLPQLMWPVLGGGITSRYGFRWGRRHTGIDIRAAVGEPVFAAHAGRVVFSGVQGGYGTVVQLRSSVITTYYAHLSRTMVREGERVAQGDLVGFAGNSGNTTGPHCHFETRVSEGSGEPRPINPVHFFPRAPTVVARRASSSPRLG